MQKLEDEPEIEFRNIHSAYNGLRDGTLSTEEGQQRLAAWQAGLTGYPMVDACMRYCQATGWLNFRMRAMLASFAAYHLWLPWRQPALFLARHFLDFEPGIHFAQFQMQSGTTGINTLRIYSPAKQLADQDPHGTFVRRWVPELEGVPDGWLAEPHRMPQSIQQSAACRIGRDYPMPIVDHATAYRKARAALGAVRRTPAAAAEAKRVYARHGSRKQPVRPEFSGAAPRGDFKEKERQGEFQF
jgi:deoxyribodipyrimidine photo-lyase